MLLLVLMFLLYWTPPVNQQTVTVEVTANVLAALVDQTPTIRTIYDIDFTVMDERQTFISIDPIKNQAGSEGGAGYILLAGKPKTEFYLSYTAEVDLVNVQSGQKEAIIYYTISHSSSANQLTSLPITSQPLKFQLNSIGEYHLWVGGQVDISKLKDGDYDGQMVLEINYASN